MSWWRRRPAEPALAAAADAGARYHDLVLHFGGIPGLRPGERRFPGRPQPAGVEVEAWQAYAPGDDLRHLDWTVLGRLDALLVRRFTAEREVVAHLLVDASASMADDKRAAAAELVLALAAIALRSGHSVRLVVLRGDGPPWVSALHRRAASLPQLAGVLGGAVPAGALDLGAALGEWARQRPEPAAALVVSDLLVDAAGLAPGVRALGRAGAPVHLLHVLGPAELTPEEALGSGLLVDAETGAAHAIAMDPDTLARYRGLLDAHLAALAEVAAAAGARYARLELPRPVAAFIADDLVRLGLVRPRGR